jgi:ribonucleotide reductase alpha subunit
MNDFFIKNKYYRWYFSIIEAARSRGLHTYTEKHHIIPKSFGGSNESNNIVALTAREHFICHLLLVKFTVEKYKSKMITAAFNMVHMNKQKVNSRIYEKLKFQHKNNMKLNNPMHNPITRQKLSETNKGKPSSRKGKTLSLESRKIISEKAKGREPWNKGKKLDYNNGLTTHTEETKKKIREARAKQTISHSVDTRLRMSESAKRRWQKEKNECL